MKIRVLKDSRTAKKVGEFLTSRNAFEQTWAPKEKAMVLQAPLDSLSKKKHRYWYIETDGKIVGACGIRENKYGSGGYEMDSDYIAVHKDYRKRGLGSDLLKRAEGFLVQRSGRYIHVVSCDIDSYRAARAFYVKHGYRKVAEIPN